MITIGELLHNAREKKKLTLAQVEKVTKIRSKFLEAMENNQFEKIPAGTFARGFVKNYAAFLGINPDEALAFYRRQVLERPAKIAKVIGRPLAGGFTFSSQFLTVLGVVLLLVIFFGYLIFSFVQFSGSPPLVVSAPSNNLVVASDQIEVLGKTDPESQLFINDQSVPVSENGSFAVKIPLSPGLNTLRVTAVNKFKRGTTLVRNVRLEK